MTVPVPKLDIFADRVPLLPFALANAPLATIALADAVVEKLCDEVAQTPLGSDALLARTR